MKELKLKIAASVLAIAVIISGLEYLVVRFGSDSNGVRVTRMTEVFALMAVALLYLFVIYYPAAVIFPQLLTDKLRLVRNGIGIAAVYFTVWHVILAFFTQLGGFAGLQFLNQRYLLAIAIGFCSLLAMMVIVFGAYAAAKWRLLRSRQISLIGYLLLLLTSLHALMLGNHFTNILDFIPQLFVALLVLLLLLEAYWLESWLRGRFKYSLQFGPLLVGAVALGAVVLTLMVTLPTTVSFNVHSDHVAASGLADLPVPQPATPLSNQVSKTFSDYKVTLFKSADGKSVEIDLQRISAPTTAGIGEGSLLMVNQVDYSSFTIDGTLDKSQTDKLAFSFPLTTPDFSQGVYSIFGKFYLSTGALLVNFSVSLP